MWRGGAWDSLSKLKKALILETPEGMYKVKNLYVDPTTGNLIIEYEDTPEEG